MNTIKITEDTLQRQCVTWFRWANPQLALRLWHSPNGGSRNVIEAAKLKSMGVVPGVCDLLLTVPRNGYSGCFIELKVGNNSLSEKQEAFIKAHEQDYSCHVVYSLEQFQNVIKSYLG
jgi:hypothetical protein